MIKETKKKATLMKKRKIAIIAVALVIAILLGVYALAARFLKPTYTYYDSDGTLYYVKYKDGAYGMYTEDGVLLGRDGEYGYFVTSFGSLIEINPETGATLSQIILDAPADGESATTATNPENVRILVFPYLDVAQILKLEVSNAEGNYSIIRIDEDGKLSASGDLILKDGPNVSLDPEKIPSLYSGARYTVATQKVIDPIKDEKGEYSEYGLVSETRVNDEGEEYLYTPATYKLTATDGKVHKMIIGDMLVSGNGYYAQYINVDADGNETKRDTVYVLQPTTTQSLLAPIEDFVKPVLTYPMTITNYFDVENFSLVRKDGADYDEIVNFSYIDIADRENTVEALFPYAFGKELDGYRPSSEVIDILLQAMYEPTSPRVEKVVITDRNYYKTLSEYGFYTPYTDDKGETDYTISADYIITFDFDATDENGNVIGTVNNMVLLCKNENGNYYAYTVICDVKGSGDDRELEVLYSYDTILELDGTEFSFLEYDKYKWISRNYFEINIAFCDKITLYTKDYSATFDLDNSASDISTSKSDRLTINATSSDGKSKQTFGSLVFRDISGYDWVVTSTTVSVTLNGASQKIVSSYYANNAMGAQARCLEGYVVAADGSHVYVTADTVKINRPDGRVEEYLRYDTDNFRKFFLSLTNASIVDSYDLTKEEEDALVADPSKHILTMTMTDTDGKTITYEFYKLTARKAYIRVNGNGGFYVLPVRVEKFISDAQRFFNNQIIDPLAKN